MRLDPDTNRWSRNFHCCIAFLVPEFPLTRHYQYKMGVIQTYRQHGDLISFLNRTWKT